MNGMIDLTHSDPISRQGGFFKDATTADSNSTGVADTIKKGVDAVGIEGYQEHMQSREGGVLDLGKKYVKMNQNAIHNANKYF